MSFYKGAHGGGPRAVAHSWAEGQAACPLPAPCRCRLRACPPALTEADRCPTPEMALDRLGEVWQQQKPFAGHPEAGAGRARGAAAGPDGAGRP